MIVDDYVKLITAAGLIVTPIMVAYFGNKSSKAANEVKQALQTNDAIKLIKIEAVEKKVQEVHALVNSGLGEALDKIAKLTNDPKDIAAAELHRERQAVADSVSLARAQGKEAGIAQEKAKVESPVSPSTTAP